MELIVEPSSLYLQRRAKPFSPTIRPVPRWVFLPLFLVLVLSTNPAFSGSIVNYLPGLNGELPFKLETGYVSVDDSELFYYFIESRGNPGEDPLFIWLTGGPGCSSLSAILYGIGPLEFNISHYPGGLPTLLSYEYAWTKTASIIFLDQPAGCGFSYSRTQQGWPSSDTRSAEQIYQFLRKWLEEHPKYLPLQLFIGGDSYSGLIVPLITKKIIEGVETEAMPRMNLRGYLLGSPITDEFLNSNSKIAFAHRMALIPDELYWKLKTSCHENYVDVDPSNVECLAALGDYRKCIDDLSTDDILEPKCDQFDSPKPNIRNGQRYLQEGHLDYILSPLEVQELWCRNFNYTLSYVWANDSRVQEALHVRQGTVLKWNQCNRTISYTRDVHSVIDVHEWLSKHSLEVLIEGGDRDMVVPFVATETWLKALNLTVSDPWRPWFVTGQVAGYTRKYAQDFYQLTYVTVKGGGHTAPEYNRRECFEMFLRWVHYYPL